jgi:hypothetical protein
VTVHEKFVEDMRVAGIVTAPYRGRFFWEGPAARSDQQNGPTLQDIIKKTTVPLQWEALNSNYIVYPVGKAGARWKDSETQKWMLSSFTRQSSSVLSG